MKFRIQLKDPDGFYDGIDDAAHESLKDGLVVDKQEIAALKKVRKEKVESFLERWVEFCEYVTIEFDTDAGTAIVVERD